MLVNIKELRGKLLDIIETHLDNPFTMQGIVVLYIY